VIGPLEIVIIVLILLVIFGYKLAPHLPGIGRKAGAGARDLKDTVSEKAPDAKSLGQRAGEGLREAREFRDVLTGKEIPDAAPRKREESDPPQDDQNPPPSPAV
jgi:Sec-independent protein translocase protein TatA